MEQKQKAFYYLILAFLMTLVSWIYLIYNYTWSVFIPIFCIILAIKIAEKWNLKNKE